MTIGELTYSLGAVWDKASLANIKDGLKSVAKDFIGAVGIASASMAGIFGLTKEFANVNDELGKLARNKDVTVGFLQSLEYGFESAGVSGSKVGDVLGNLKDQAEGFKKGNADYEAFSIIGVDPTAFKNNEDYFNAVLDGIKSVQDEDTKSDLTKRLLGDADLKNLVDGGSDAIRQQKEELKEMGILINDMDYKKSAKFKDTLLKTMTYLKGLVNKVMVELMPLFTSLMEIFNSFLLANNELISSGLAQFFDIIITSSKFLIALFTRVIGQILSFKPALILIAGLLILWQLPLIATIGIITTLFVLVDELFNFFKNEDSLIGDWLGVAGIDEFTAKFPKITATFRAVADILTSMFTALKNQFFNIWDLLTGKISFGEFLGNQIDIVSDLLGSLKDTFMSFVNWIISLFSKIDLFSGISRQIDNVKKSISNFVPEIPSISDVSSGISSLLGFNTAPQVQPVQASPVQQPTQGNKTENIYHISANVDAKSKSISESISEITNVSGY